MLAVSSSIGVQGDDIELVHETVPDQQISIFLINTMAGVRLNVVQVDTGDTFDSGDLGSATDSDSSSIEGFTMVRSKKKEKKKSKGRRKNWCLKMRMMFH